MYGFRYCAQADLDAESCCRLLQEIAAALLDPKAKDQDALALVQHLAESQRFDKLLENQQLLREPIVRNGRAATVGYAPEVWSTWE